MLLVTVRRERCGGLVPYQQPPDRTRVTDGQDRKPMHEIQSYRPGRRPPNRYTSRRSAVAWHDCRMIVAAVINRSSIHSVVGGVPCSLRQVSAVGGAPSLSLRRPGSGITHLILVLCLLIFTAHTVVDGDAGLESHAYPRCSHVHLRCCRHCMRSRDDRLLENLAFDCGIGLAVLAQVSDGLLDIIV